MGNILKKNNDVFVKSNLAKEGEKDCFLNKNNKLCVELRKIQREFREQDRKHQKQRKLDIFFGIALAVILIVAGVINL